MNRPFVSVILPVRNEAAFIERTLRAVLDQDWPATAMEVIVVDGDSDDGTADIARAILASAECAGDVLTNSRGVTPLSMNLGLRRARGGVIVRVDGHCEPAPDYVRRCVDVLEATGAACVGGVCLTEAETDEARTIAVAQSSPFGVGNVAFRIGRTAAGPADTVPFGAWPREVFDAVGTFDEELVRNQDDELAFRIIQAGGIVWYDPAIRSRYFSRATLRQLGRQYWQYGLYKVRVMQKRGGVASWRHVVPGLFVGSLVVGLLLSALTRQARWVTLPAAPYAAAVTAESLRLAHRHQVAPARLAAAFATLHLAYGGGFLAGIWRWRRAFRSPGGSDVSGRLAPGFRGPGSSAA